MAQFIDAPLLLSQQALTQNLRRGGGNAVIERTLATQMRNVGSADHDLGRHTSDVDAGAAESAALDQRHTRPLLDGLQRRRHRRAAAADHGHVQCSLIVLALWFAAQPLLCIVQQVAGLPRRIGKLRSVTECGYRRDQRGHVRGGTYAGLNLGPALWVGH